MNEKPNIAITDSEWLIVKDILKRYLPRHQVWAFGSRVQGAHKPFSDLDIAVISEQPMELSLLAAVNEAFSESNLPWKVDVVDWMSVSDAFRRLIEAHKVSLQ
jgi:predicted nucleotidyltransferase